MYPFVSDDMTICSFTRCDFNELLMFVFVTSFLPAVVHACLSKCENYALLCPTEANDLFLPTTFYSAFRAKKLSLLLCIAIPIADNGLLNVLHYITVSDHIFSPTQETN